MDNLTDRELDILERALDARRDRLIADLGNATRESDGHLRFMIAENDRLRIKVSKVRTPIIIR